MVGFSKKWFKPPDGEKKVHAYHSAVEKQVQPKLSAFHDLINNQAAASQLLLIATIIALIWGSVDVISPYYHNIVNFDIGLRFGTQEFSASLQTLINDFLLTIFFFLVGLEIKKEFLVGELNESQKAVAVMVAALGGILLPAGIFFLINHHYPEANGWAIPIATDTAFAIGVMKTFKHHLPSGALAFTAALAIVDDIAAISIIALYYTPTIHTMALLWAGFTVILLISMNLMGFRSSWPYVVFGLLLWILFESAGIHGTVAGILVAFCIPARPHHGPRHVRKKLQTQLEKLNRKSHNPAHILEDEKQHHILEQIEETIHTATTPLQRWQHNLKWPVLLLVLPLFAFANAGIDVSSYAMLHALQTRVTIGVALALAIGKPLGILLFVFLAQRLKIGKIPEDCRLQHIVAVALLSGIGFTMSLFIATQGYDGMPSDLHHAKVGIIVGSSLSALAGILWIRWMIRRTK